MSSGESLVDIAAAASTIALDRAGIRPADLDAIIVGTVSSEYGFPSFACQLQHRLGLDSIPAFDVAAACSGFVYALSVADNAMRAGDYSRVLLVGTDALSTMVDWNDRARLGAVRRWRRGGRDGFRARAARRARQPAALFGRVLASALGTIDGRARHAGFRGAALARRRDQDERAGAVQDRGELMADVTLKVAERAGVMPRRHLADRAASGQHAHHQRGRRSPGRLARTRSSPTSIATATPRPPRCRSHWTRRSKPAASTTTTW